MSLPLPPQAPPSTQAAPRTQNPLPLRAVAAAIASLLLVSLAGCSSPRTGSAQAQATPVREQTLPVAGTPARDASGAVTAPAASTTSGATDPRARGASPPDAAFDVGRPARLVAAGDACLRSLEAAINDGDEGRVMLGSAAFAHDDRLMLEAARPVDAQGRLLDGRRRTPAPVVHSLRQVQQRCVVARTRPARGPAQWLPACQCEALPR